MKISTERITSFALFILVVPHPARSTIERGLVKRCCDVATNCRAIMITKEPVPGGDSRLPGVFISYRRELDAGWAPWLYDKLSDHFGRDRIFMDLDSIAAGDDFVEVITRSVASCRVLIALIGKDWAG